MLKRQMPLCWKPASWKSLDLSTTAIVATLNLAIAVNLMMSDSRRSILDALLLVMNLVGGCGLYYHLAQKISNIQIM